MCPHVNKADRRCAAHFILSNVGRAFEHCANRYDECPVYREVLAHAKRCKNAVGLARFRAAS